MNSKIRPTPDHELYLLDTSVLLIDPESIHSYPQAAIIIPISAIEELDRFKHQINEAGRNSRLLIKDFDQLRAKNSLGDWVKLKNEALLKIWIDQGQHPKIDSFADMSRTANKVLSCALNIKDHFPKYHLTLVSNDMNLRIKASLYDIEATAYQEEGISASKVYEKLKSFAASDEERGWLAKFDHIPLKKRKHQLYPNEPVLLGGSPPMLCRYVARSDYLKPVPSFEQGVWNITPRNLEQRAALDILLDKNIDIVVLAGKAGTGKTLLALAAALQSLIDNDTRKILVSRPIVPLGKDLGYLPGDVEEKITPWMQPIFDNLEFLTSSSYKKANRLGNMKQLLNRGLLELEALTYIRGRSIPNRFMIVDEAQNLTPHEAKTIITRIGYNTKLVMTGDPFQIDNPYVDSVSNGLAYVIEKLKAYEEAAHVTLLSGERSRLAELAANVL